MPEVFTINKTVWTRSGDRWFASDGKRARTHSDWIRIYADGSRPWGSQE